MGADDGRRTRGARPHGQVARESRRETTRPCRSALPRLRRWRAHPSQWRVGCGSDEMIGPTMDFAEVLGELSVCELPWEQFAQGEWWGLPPVEVAPVVRPMPWASTSDALAIAAVFGVPPASSNMEVFQFLVGYCEPPPAWVEAQARTVNKLANSILNVTDEAEAVVEEKTVPEPAVSPVVMETASVQGTPTCEDAFAGVEAEHGDRCLNAPHTIALNVWNANTVLARAIVTRLEDEHVPI
ncbi:hypothetical protein AB1Y20_003813 [Prymnesium parvum]|uniref:Uncharacterized protein n=1 Tax=Prymnesium parvum TaxID=97485 RepID=A0AB34J844_PRYPA